MEREAREARLGAKRRREEERSDDERTREDRRSGGERREKNRGNEKNDDRLSRLHSLLDSTDRSVCATVVSS